jgi:hypothetical protein
MTGGTIAMLLCIIVVFIGGTGTLLARSLKKPSEPDEEE